MDHKTMNTGGDTVMDDKMTNAAGNTAMNGTMANDGGNTTMNGRMANNSGNTTMNGRMANNSGNTTTTGKMAKTGASLGQGVLWLGATALALFGAKYAWQRAQQNLRNTNVDPKYLETAEKMVDSVVGGSITH
jgi:hypothetical protein